MSWVYDLFTGTDGANPSTVSWTINEPANTTVDIQSNALRMAVTGGATNKSASVVPVINLYGDPVDVQVDFSALALGADNNVVALVFTNANAKYVLIEAIQISGVQKTRSGKNFTGSWTFPTTVNRTNNYGKFRLKRVGTTVETWYQDGGGAWTHLDTITGYVDASVGLVFYMTLFNSSGGGNPTCSFDNVIVNDGSVGTTTVTVPPFILTWTIPDTFPLPIIVDTPPFILPWTLVVGTEQHEPIPYFDLTWTLSAGVELRVSVAFQHCWTLDVAQLSPISIPVEFVLDWTMHTTVPMQANLGMTTTLSVGAGVGCFFDFVKSLPISGDIVFVKGLGLDKTFDFVKGLSVSASGDFSFVKSIAYTDAGGADVAFVKSLVSVEGGVGFVKMISQGSGAAFDFVKGLGAWQAEGGIDFVKNTIGGEGADFAFVKSIATVGLTLAQAVTVAIGGVDVTARVISVDINLFSLSTMISSCTVMLKSLALPDGGDIVITIEGVDYLFTAEEISENRKTHEIEVWGRDISCALSQPEASQIIYDYSGDDAATVAADLAGAYDLSWQIDDYGLAVASGTASPMDIVSTLAKAAGGVLRAVNGTLNVVFPYTDTAPVSALPWALKMTRDRKPATYDAVTVNFGSGATQTILIETDTPEVPVGAWAVVRVYAIAPYELTTSASAKILDAAVVFEEVIEDITLDPAPDNGPSTGKLKKPVLAVLAIDGCPDARVIGGEVTSVRGCELVTVRYATRFDRWRVTNYAAATKLICSAVSQSAATVREGTGARVLVINEPLIATASAALRRAQRELMDASGPWTVTVTVPYDAAICNPVGVNVMTPWGRGVVTAVSIKISANPLKILNTMEVRLWPQEPV